MGKNRDVSTGSVKGKIKGGIGVRLMGMFVILILVPLLIMGFTMYGKSKTILKANLQESSDQLLLQTESSVYNFLSKYEVMVNGMAENSAFKRSNELSTPDQQRLIGYDSEFQALYSNDPYKQQAWEMLDDLHSLNKELQWVYLGTKNGDMLERPDGDLNVGYDPRVRGWYKAALAEKKLIWTEPYPDSSTNTLVITVAAPIIGEASEVEGVVGMDVTLVDMSRELNSIKIGENGYAFLIDQFDNVMTHEDPNLIGLSLDSTKVEIEGAVRESYNKETEIFTRVLDGIKAGDRVVKLTDGNFALLHSVDKFGWTLVGVINENEFKSDAQEILKWLEIIGVLSLIVALFISFIFANSLTTRIRKMLDAMGRVKEGDLTAIVEIKSKDEIGLLGEYFTDTLKQLGLLIRSIQGISYEVTEAAQHLAATSEQTSASADEVARTVEEIARGASDQAQDAESGVIVAQSLSDKFNNLNERTLGMITTAEEVVIANTHGTDAIDALKEKTKQTDEANENISNVIVELDSKTQSIGAILDSISAISVQTNLLALNASIEAARAGEHGRGFAVVAEEIRKLAEESSSSAEEIRGIVTTIISYSSKTVESMGVVRGFSKEQTEAVSNVDNSFNITSKSISSIVSEIQTIKESVEELIGDKDSIVNAIGNISAVSEETAAASEEVSASMEQQTMAVEEVAKAAEQMNEIAVNLNEELSKFRII